MRLSFLFWLRGQVSNLESSGSEPDVLPNSTTPQYKKIQIPKSKFQIQNCLEIGNWKLEILIISSAIVWKLGFVSLREMSRRDRN